MSVGAPRNASHPQSSTAVCTSSSTDNQQPTTDNSSTYSPLPEIVAKSIPILHCATGTAARIDREDGVTIHLAFFEWESTDSANVLEAFKHLPECCMGSIGMTLMEHRPTRAYLIGRETLSFEHAVFRDLNGVIVHTFKGVWVSGLSDLMDGDYRSAYGERLLRYKVGLHRIRPAHARVAQGAVRGVLNPDLAWQTFQDAMLADLKFE